MEYDYIIIGNNINSLITAYYLSKLNKKILIINNTIKYSNNIIKLSDYYINFNILLNFKILRNDLYKSLNYINIYKHLFFTLYIKESIFLYLEYIKFKYTKNYNKNKSIITLIQEYNFSLKSKYIINSLCILLNINTVSDFFKINTIYKLSYISLYNFILNKINKIPNITLQKNNKIIKINYKYDNIQNIIVNHKLKIYANKYILSIPNIPIINKNNLELYFYWDKKINLQLKYRKKLLNYIIIDFIENITLIIIIVPQYNNMIISHYIQYNYKKLKNTFINLPHPTSIFINKYYRLNYNLFNKNNLSILTYSNNETSFINSIKLINKLEPLNKIILTYNKINIIFLIIYFYTIFKITYLEEFIIIIYLSFLFENIYKYYFTKKLLI